MKSLSDRGLIKYRHSDLDGDKTQTSKNSSHKAMKFLYEQLNASLELDAEHGLQRLKL